MRSRSTCDQADVAKACNSNQFQSQMRSRSTCDIASCLHLLYRPEFQSQMRSRSTCDYHCSLLILKISFVSISDEKPLHMRLHTSSPLSGAICRFQSQMRSRSTCDLIFIMSWPALSEF